MTSLSLANRILAALVTFALAIMVVLVMIAVIKEVHLISFIDLERARQRTTVLHSKSPFSRAA